MPNEAATQEPTAEDQMSQFEAFAAPIDTSTDGAPVVEPAVAETPEVEAAETPEAETEEPATEETEQTPEQKGAAEGKKPKKTAQERINEITRARHQADRDLAAEREARRALEERLAAVEKRGLTPEKPGATKDASAEPKADDFEYGELDSRYIEAKIEYGVKSALAAAKAEDETKRQSEAAAAKQTELQTKYQSFEKIGLEKYDDFEDVVIAGARSGAWKPTPVIGELALGSEVGPDVIYHIASNPKEWAAVSGKSPLEQAAYFGRLEAKFSSASDVPNQPVQVKTTKAPPPVKPVRGAGSKTSFDPRTCTQEEFEAHYGS